MSEAALLAALARDGIPAARARVAVSAWSNGPGDEYAAHRHDYDKVLLVEEGSIRFALPDLDRSVELEAGNRLDLPAGTLHAASVGANGVRCLEAHLPARSLTTETATARRA